MGENIMITTAKHINSTNNIYFREQKYLYITYGLEVLIKSDLLLALTKTFKQKNWR